MKNGSEKTFFCINTLFVALFVFGSVTAFTQSVRQNSTTAQLKGLASNYERAELYDKAASVYRLLCVQNPTDIPSYLAAKRCYLKIKERSEERRVGKECRSRW